ncbi:MAG: TonB-dependent receptor plug domain-containing protein [Pseudomonadales bacterium]
MNSSINNAMDRTTTGCAAFLYRLFISLAFLAASTGAMAASSERGRVIEEIIVTAEKRAESVLDVPLTLSAFDETLVTELGITNESDLEVLVPGLQFGDYGESVGQGTVIRGIGSRLAGETHSDLAVATYIDGVYTLGTYGVAPSFFDLERVEVARGPQGTLHGRNSIAGSISYYTKKPTDEWDLVALVEYTDQFTQRYNVAGGGLSRTACGSAFLAATMKAMGRRRTEALATTMMHRIKSAIHRSSVLKPNVLM